MTLAFAPIYRAEGMDTGAALDAGFGAGVGEATTGLVTCKLLAVPSAITSAEENANAPSAERTQRFHLFQSFC